MSHSHVNPVWSLGVRLGTKFEMRLLSYGRGMYSYPYMDDPPLPVPVGSPPWIIKSCKHNQVVSMLSLAPGQSHPFAEWEDQGTKLLNALTHRVKLTQMICVQLVIARIGCFTWIVYYTLAMSCANMSTERKWASNSTVCLTARCILCALVMQ